MIIDCQVSISSLLVNIPKHVLKAMAQPTRSSQRTSVEERGPIQWVKIKISLECVGLVVLISFSIGKSSGSKSNKNSKDYAFPYTFPYSGYVK